MYFNPPAFQILLSPWHCRADRNFVYLLVLIGLMGEPAPVSHRALHYIHRISSDFPQSAPGPLTEKTLRAVLRSTLLLKGTSGMPSAGLDP